MVSLTEELTPELRTALKIEQTLPVLGFVIPDVGELSGTARKALLSEVRAGTVVCIKQLAASADVMNRLREMGFCEEQQIKLISREGNLICQVCNARLGISAQLAESILVKPLPARLKAA